MQLAEDTRKQLASLEAALSQARWEPAVPGLGVRWGAIGFERRRKHAKLLKQVMTELANPYSDVGRGERNDRNRDNKHTSTTLKNSMHPGLRSVAKEFEVLLSALTQTATRSFVAADDSDAWFSVVLNNQINRYKKTVEK